MRHAPPRYTFERSPPTGMGRRTGPNARPDGLLTRRTPGMLAKCLLVAAALRTALSAVAHTVAKLGRETLRKAIASSLPKDPVNSKIDWPPRGVRRLHAACVEDPCRSPSTFIAGPTTAIATVSPTRAPSHGACGGDGGSGWESPVGVRVFGGLGSCAGCGVAVWSFCGIESSYRQLGECLAVTTSREVVYRLLLVGLSLLIRAWWVLEQTTTLTRLRWNLIVHLTPTTATTATTTTHATQTLTNQTLTTT